MGTKNKKSVSNILTFENALDTFSLVNTIALSSTEKIFNKGFSLIEKAQNTTDKYLKKGLAFSADKQEMTFDKLDETKAYSIKSFKKIQKKFKKS